MKDASLASVHHMTEIPDLVLNFVIPATNMAVRRMLHGLNLSLLANGLSDAVMEHVEIVLAEVLNNVVEHAYADRQRGTIAMVTRLKPHKLEIELIDTGAPMPNDQLPSGTLSAHDTADGDLPEGGFGWHLIRALTDRLDYVREKGQNRLTLHIPRTVGGMC